MKKLISLLLSVVMAVSFSSALGLNAYAQSNMLHAGASDTSMIDYTYYANGKIRKYYNVKLKKTVCQVLFKGLEWFGLNDIESAGGKHFDPNEPYLDFLDRFEDSWDELYDDECIDLLVDAYRDLSIDPDSTDLEKFMLIARWIYENIHYSYDENGEPNTSFDSTWHALKYGEVVCSGYAALTRDLCYLYDIPCAYVSGMTLNGGHAWNCVCLDGKWLQVDNTGSGFFYAELDNYFSNHDYNNPEDVKTYLANDTPATYITQELPCGWYKYSKSSAPIGFYTIEVKSENKKMTYYNPYMSKQTFNSTAMKKALLNAYITAKNHTFSDPTYEDSYQETDECAHIRKIFFDTPATTKEVGKHGCTCEYCGETLSCTYIPRIKTVKLKKNEYMYNGTNIQPTVVIYDTNGKKLDWGTDYDIKYPSRSNNVGKYTLKVVFKGEYTGYKRLSYAVFPKKTKITSLKAGKKSFTVKWKPIKAQCDGYFIEYATKKDFSNSQSVYVQGKNTCYKKIKGLKKGKTYYVRVSTNKKGYVSDSETRKIKVR